MKNLILSTLLLAFAGSMAQTTPTNTVTSILPSQSVYDMLPGDTMSIYVTLNTTLGGYAITLKTFNPYSSAFTPTSIKYMGGGVYKCLITNDGTVFGSTCNGIPTSTNYVIKALIKRNGYDATPVLQNVASPSFTVNQICDSQTSTAEVDQPATEPIYFNLYGEVVRLENSGFYIVKTGSRVEKKYIQFSN